jgi:hypothetical protein
MNLEKLEVRGQGDLRAISQISLKESRDIYKFHGLQQQPQGKQQLPPF